MFTVRVEKTAEQEIDYDDWNVGISTTGDVIVLDENFTLCKFNLQQDGLYREQWRRRFPEGISSSVRRIPKYLTETGDVILQNTQENSTTFLFDQDMKLKDSWQHQGYLIGWLPGPRTVYVVRKPKGYLVEIKSQNGELMQLKPERNPWSSTYMSVCENGRAGKLVVVHYDGGDSSIHIFSAVGKTKNRIHTKLLCNNKCIMGEFGLRDFSSCVQMNK